tara:strand:+ start:4454 stop:5929 length:1476 start_codon:yes stop_codon:yes gene_type:complete
MILSKKYRGLAVEIISVLFVILFVYAAVSKVFDFGVFVGQLAQSPLLSAFAYPIAVSVPSMEIGIAVLLMISKFRYFALFASYMIMVMFTTYILIILNFSDFIPCSCGGVLEKLSWTQHLLFNICFIVLSGIAIFCIPSDSRKNKIILLGILMIIGVGIVSFLFILSEEQTHRNNAFIRRYPHHPIKTLDTLNLTYNSYYFAGIDSTNIYLGNYTAPLKILKVSRDLKDTVPYQIELPRLKLPYRSTNIKIIGKNFFLSDGTVPILYKGDINTWSVDATYQELPYFSKIVPITSEKLVIRTLESEKEHTVLGTLFLQDSIEVNLKQDALTGSIDEYFDRDGILLFNRELNRLIYVYYYKSEYERIDPYTWNKTTHKTIDTISKPILDIHTNTKTGRRSLGGKSIMVNILAATYNNLLFINSTRLGRYEPDYSLETRFIFDVYDIAEGTYLLSFTIDRYNKERLIDVQVSGDDLYVLMANDLRSYRIKNKFK